MDPKFKQLKFKSIFCELKINSQKILSNVLNKTQIVTHLWAITTASKKNKKQLFSSLLVVFQSVKNKNKKTD